VRSRKCDLYCYWAQHECHSKLLMSLLHYLVTPWSYSVLLIHWGNRSFTLKKNRYKEFVRTSSYTDDLEDVNSETKPVFVRYAIVAFWLYRLGHLRPLCADRSFAEDTNHALCQNRKVPFCVPVIPPIIAPSSVGNDDYNITKWPSYLGYASWNVQSFAMFRHTL
jgi:hypothetical protein